MIASRKTVLLLLFVILTAVFIGAFWSFSNKKQSPAEEETNEHHDLEQVVVLPPAESATSPSQSDSTTTTPGFKLYRNEEWGFEFEHPQNWFLDINSFYSPFSKFNLQAGSPEDYNSWLPTFLLNIVTPDFADRAAMSRRNTRAAVESDIVVDGVFGNKFEYNTEYGTKISIDLPFGENRMIIATYKEDEDILDKILISLKFIEPSKSNQ